MPLVTPRMRNEEVDLVMLGNRARTVVQRIWVCVRFCARRTDKKLSIHLTPIDATHLLGGLLHQYLGILHLSRRFRSRHADVMLDGVQPTTVGIGGIGKRRG